MQNFGQIHETFKEVLANGIVDGVKNKKEVFKAYVKELKENAVLKTQFQVFDKLENKVNTENIEKNKMFVEECVSLLENIGANKVNETNTNLVNYLKDKGFDLLQEYPNKNLHEHIHN